MDTRVAIIEKPDFVGWDDVKSCLWEAHSPNREKGIVMTHCQWASDVIRDYVGEDGKMLVAMDGDKLVGTAAIVTKTGNRWYNRGRYGYLCFASVLPEYAGKGIYGKLLQERERLANEMGLRVILFDTHENNRRIISINRKNGYCRVAVKVCPDHMNVVMAKILSGSAYPHLSTYCRYCLSKLRSYILYSKNDDNQYVESWINKMLHRPR